MEILYIRYRLFKSDVPEFFSSSTMRKFCTFFRYTYIYLLTKNLFYFFDFTPPFSKNCFSNCIINSHVIFAGARREKSYQKNIPGVN